jgi:hypothetical protein
MKKISKFQPDSRWVRYDAKSQMWIPNRKRIYLYWYKYLQIVLSEYKNNLNWEIYSEWGTPEEILTTPFDIWWSKHWKNLFGYAEGKAPKYAISTMRPKTDAIRYALLVHQNRHRGNNWEIAKWLQHQESTKRGIPIPSFAYASSGVTAGTEDKMIIQSRVGRYKSLSNRIIKNVCQGVFP